MGNKQHSNYTLDPSTLPKQHRPPKQKSKASSKIPKKQALIIGAADYSTISQSGSATNSATSHLMFD